MKGAERKPVIGITCRRMDYKLEPWMTRQQGALQSMIDGVERGGGAPVLIPLIDNEAALRSIYNSLDGVLLVGGGDVNPNLYGEEPHVPLINPDDLLDKVEMPLVRWAVADGKPLMGICRGHQIINVTLGGSLFQDAMLDVPTTIDHNEAWVKHTAAKLMHDITLTADSKLAELLGTTHLKVNSTHHQSVNRLGEGLKITAVAPDGVVEGVEGTGAQYLLGIQSHPEHVAAGDPRWQNVFSGLVRAATTYDRVSVVDHY